METDSINPASAGSIGATESAKIDPVESTKATTVLPLKPAASETAAKPDSIPLSDNTPAHESISPDSPTVKESIETPATAPAPAPVPATASEVIAERIQVAASDSWDAEDVTSGGEWDLLNAKVRQWWKENNFAELWQRSRRPLVLIVGLIAFTLLIRIYSGILAAIGTIPLAPRLFELVGLGWMTWFSSTRLIRSDERKALFLNLKEIWTAFRGSVRS